MPNLTIRRIKGTGTVWRLFQRWPLPVNTFVVDDGHRLILIDTGNVNRPGEMLGGVRRIEQASGKRLGAVVMTHGHKDHMGALAEIVTATGVPVYAHPDEIPFLVGERFYSDVPGWWGYYFPRRPPGPTIPAGAVRPLGDGERLGPLQAFHTPGHAPGHLAFWHGDAGAWFTGDVLAHLLPWVHGPLWPFTYDIGLVRRSARRFLEVGPLRALIVSHGAPVTVRAEERLRRYLRRAGVL